MIVLDEPFVSEYLARSALACGVPILDTPAARAALAGHEDRLWASRAFAEEARRAESLRLYCNSENSLDWVLENLDGTHLSAAIHPLKDKVAFRELLRPLDPDYRFFAVPLAELGGFDPSALDKPFVAKPAAGFFSLGVHSVPSDEAWPAIAAEIEAEVSRLRGVYPERVVELDRFVFEETIPGEELAVDAYYRSDGRPVILNVMQHVFPSDGDVNDRLYLASAEIVARWHEPFTEHLEQIGRLAGLRDFPVHAELRVDEAGRIQAIEVNPLRFGGWCAADIAHFAYGFDPYHAYLRDGEPDWKAIAHRQAGRTCAIVVADLPSDLDRTRILDVDYEALLARFKKPLEVRRTDYRRFPVFAFVFAEVDPDDLGELDPLLRSDLLEFLRLS